jgi:MFS superfamily sulfate permease-like transporter
MYGCFVSLLRNAAANNQIDLKFYKDIRGSLEIKCNGTLTFINCLDFEIKVIDMIKKENPSKVIFDMNGLIRIDVDGVDAIKNCQSKFKGKIFFEFVRDWD